jgi:uncharacterized membrane protein YidH (DUF202 family)
VLVEHLAKPRAAARARGGSYEALARVGLVAKGLSYGIVGLLAIGVAVGVGGAATSRQGALKQLAASTFGAVLLVLLALGFAAYALWRFVQAAATAEDDEKKEWSKRAGYVGRGLIYLGLAFSSAKILAGAGGGQSQNGKAHKTTSVVLSWPGGTWLVGIAGAAIIAVGAWNLYRGVTRKFEEKWRTGELSPAAKTWAGRAGVVGHVARAVVFALIGSFAIKAAVDYNPNDAVGLDGALQKLAHQGYGPYLLGLTAAGLVAYGVYCLADARYCDVSA